MTTEFDPPVHALRRFRDAFVPAHRDPRRLPHAARVLAYGREVVRLRHLERGYDA